MDCLSGDMSWADEVNDAVEAGELPSMPIEKDCIQRNEGLWYAQASFIETSINSTLSPEASPYSHLFEPDHLTGTPPSHSLKVSDDKSSTAACYLSGNVNTAGNENLQLLERHWFDNIWKQVSPKHEVEDKDVREPAISRSVSSVNERMRLNERQMLREWGKLESNFYAHWAINGWPEGSSKYKKAMREKKIRAWNKKRQARIERPWVGRTKHNAWSKMHNDWFKSKLGIETTDELITSKERELMKSYPRHFKSRPESPSSLRQCWTLDS